MECVVSGVRTVCQIVLETEAASYQTSVIELSVAGVLRSCARVSVGEIHGGQFDSGGSDISSVEIQTGSLTIKRGGPGCHVAILKIRGDGRNV